MQAAYKTTDSNDLLPMFSFYHSNDGKVLVPMNEAAEFDAYTSTDEIDSPVKLPGYYAGIGREFDYLGDCKAHEAKKLFMLKAHDFIKVAFDNEYDFEANIDVEEGEAVIDLVLTD